MCRYAQGVRCVATLVPAHQSSPTTRGPRTALFGIAWGGPVAGATHTHLDQQRMNFHFTFPAATRSSTAQTFSGAASSDPRGTLRLGWHGASLACHAGRVGPDKPSMLVALRSCRASVTCM